MYAIGKKLIEKSGENKFRSYLIQRIIMATQSGNSTCLMSDIPSEKELEDIFDL